MMTPMAIDDSETGSRRRIAGWSLAIAGVAVAIAAGVWWSLDQGQDESPNWLFSHTATAGTLTQEADGSYTLTLTGIDPHVMAFTDRPVRDSAIVDTSALVDAWPTLFATSPPNAVLVEHHAEGEADSVIMTLTNPRLTSFGTPGSASEDLATLSFDAAVMSAEVPENLTRLTRGVHDVPVSTFANASLFIDDVTAPDPMTVVPEGWLPVSGDWNADGADSVGIFDPQTLTYHLYTDPSSSQGATVINSLPDQVELEPS